MKSYRSITSIPYNGNRLYTVENDQRRNNFNDLYPAVLIDGREFKTLSVQALGAEPYPPGRVLGIEVQASSAM